VGLSSRLAPVSDARVSLVQASIGPPVVACSRCYLPSVAAAGRPGQSLPGAAAGGIPRAPTPSSLDLASTRPYTRDSTRPGIFQLLPPTDAALGSAAPPQTRRKNF
jgi:hypothetical protein